MANTKIDIKNNGITTLATAGKYCDRNIDVNVSVPSSGITPTGSITLSENNKTYDVTSYASAVVDIPTPAQKMVVRTITISADITGADALVTHLSNDDFIKKHYADEGFSVMMFAVTPVAAAANVIHSIYQGNKSIGSSNVVRYGFLYRSSSATAIGAGQCSTPINGKGYGSQLRVASDGSLKQYLVAGNIWRAGTYNIVLSCTD